MGDAVGQRIGFAGARAGYDEQRPAKGNAADAEFNGAALLRIEFAEIGGRAHQLLRVPDPANRIVVVRT
jgi:hypothetical protein